MRTFFTLLVIAILIIIAYYLFAHPNTKTYGAVTNYEECVRAGFPIMETYPEQCRTPDGKTFTKTYSQNNTPEQPDQGGQGVSDMVRVTNLKENQVINSPVTINGQARGSWYFEASFPVEILDANNKQLTIKPAQAQGEWMTTDFVPFSVTLTFPKPTTETGFLVLHKDNPTGEARFDAELRIPIRFNDPNGQRTVKLYYYNQSLDKDASGNILCSNKGLMAVERTISADSKTPIQDTLRLFLKGELSNTEKAQGITTEFPLSGVTLTGANLSSGALALSLTDPQHKTSGGSCRVSVLKAQIEATAKQFPEVKTVRFLPTNLFQP